MDEEILIVKNKKNKMYAKVRRRTNKRFSPDSYTKVVNVRDAKDLAILFEDLNLMFNSPIEKSFFIYKERKGKSFPF